MKKMVCQICECSNFTKSNGVFVCHDCGTSYSLEEARGLLKEVDDNLMISKGTDSIVAPTEESTPSDNFLALKEELISIYIAYQEKDKLDSTIKEMRLIKNEYDFSNYFSKYLEQFKGKGNYRVPNFKNDPVIDPTFLNDYSKAFWAKFTPMLNDYCWINRRLNNPFTLVYWGTKGVFKPEDWYSWEPYDALSNPYELLSILKTNCEEPKNVFRSTHYEKFSTKCPFTWNKTVFFGNAEGTRFEGSPNLNDSIAIQRMTNNYRIVESFRKIEPFTYEWNDKSKQWSAAIHFNKMGFILSMDDFIGSYTRSLNVIKECSKPVFIKRIKTSDIDNVEKIEKCNQILTRLEEMSEKCIPDVVSKCKVLPQNYCNREFATRALLLIDNKRADNVKELINLYETEKWQNKVLDNLEQINSNIITLGKGIFGELRNITTGLKTLVGGMGLIYESLGNLSNGIEKLNDSINSLELTVDVKVDNEIKIYENIY